MPLTTDAIAVHRAAARARRWLTAPGMFALLIMAPIAAFCGLSEVSGSGGGFVFSFLTLHLAILALLGLRALGRAAPSGPLRALSSASVALALAAGVAALGEVALLLALSGHDRAHSGLWRALRSIDRLLPAASTLGFAGSLAAFALAAAPILRVARPGSAARSWLVRAYALAFASLAAPFLVWLTFFLDLEPAGWIQRILFGLSVTSYLLAFPALPWLREAMQALYPAGLGAPDEALAGLRARVAEAMDIRAEESPSPWDLRLSGRCEGAEAQVDLRLSVAPAIVEIRCPISALPLGLAAWARAAGEGPGVGLEDPVLSSALRVEGVGDRAANALFGGLHEDLLSALALHPGARIEGGWLTVPVPGPPDPAAERLAERVREIARLAAILAARAGRGAGEPARRPVAARQPAGE